MRGEAEFRRLKGEFFLEFWKMNGNGNDFVVITNGGGLGDRDLAELAGRVCRRRRSIGADGLLVVEPGGSGDFRMRIFNSDGSEGEMCGNGARCIARYAFETGVAPRRMSFQTLAGPMRAEVDGAFVDLRMGRMDPSSVRTVTFSLPGWSGEVEGDFLVVGVPHFVVYPGSLEKFSRDELVGWGRALREDRELFPVGTNVDFSEPMDGRSLRVVTYERGVEDLTDSCGTGSVASALSAAGRLGFSFPVTVHNPGGVNRVSLQEGEIVLGGMTALVAKGKIEEEA